MTTQMPPDSSGVIGRRIVCEGHIGTVVYEGLVPPNEGLWFGVDWDDSTRGKHDGSHHGKKYFSARHATSGSFVRPQKVGFGNSYCEAVRERYGYDAVAKLAAETDEAAEAMYYVGANNVAKPIELVGLAKVGRKQSQYNQLRVIVLKAMNVYGTTPDENASQFTPSAAELDLSRNLLDSWDEVAEIARQLPLLHMLDLSENRLRLPDDATRLASAFKTLKQLVLSRMEYDWIQILHCVQMWPDVRELYLPYNSITSIQEPPGRRVLQQLETLDLEANALVSWDEVLHFGRLPCLKVLNLNSCKITSVRFPDAVSGERTKYFRALSNLGFSGNKCNKWSDVAELNKLSALRELNMKSNPLCDSDSLQTVRQLFVAKVGNLRVLNHTVITPDERRGAELDYLKRFGKEWLEVKAAPRAFFEEHPRFLELVKKYGEAEAGELKTMTTTLQSKILSISISCPTLPGSASFVKKVPRTMTVQTLKGLVRRLYSVSAQELVLTYIPSETGDATSAEIALDNDLRELSYFSLETDDQVIVRW